MAKIVAQGFTTLTKINETIQIKLSNDISAISCYSDGTPRLGAFTNAYTYVEGFRGDSKIPSLELTIGQLKPSKGVEAEVVNNKIFISNLTETGGYVDIPVSHRGNFLGAYRFNVVKQLDGLEASSLKIVGENVFKYDNLNQVSPKQIFLSAIVQNIENPEFKWYYKDGRGNYQSITEEFYGAVLKDSKDLRLIESGGKVLRTSKGTLGIPHEDAQLWGERTTLTIKCEVNKFIYDEFTISKIKDGSEAYTVVLTNENHSFSSNYEGRIQPAKQTETDVVCYKGVEEINPTSIRITSPKPQGLDWVISGKRIVFRALEGTSLGDTGEINIDVVLENRITIKKVFTWNKIKSGKNGLDGANGKPGADGKPGIDGKPGVDGIGYSINITGGNRGIAYSAIGTNPEPSSAGTFTLEFLKNGKPVNPTSVSWSAGGNYSGSLGGNSKTFTPSLRGTYSPISTFVKVVAADGVNSLSQTIPIVCTKHADGLDWIEDWNSNSVVIDNAGRRIISPRIFAGTKDSRGITGVALGKDALNLTGVSPTTGLVGYKNNLPVFALTDKADFYVSSKGNSGSVVDGTANGIYFDGNQLHITGAVKIKSGTIAGSDIGTVVNNANNANNNANSAINKVQNTVATVDVEYAINTSSSTAPSQNSGEWRTSTPPWKEGSYIWSRNKTTLVNGKFSYSQPVCITGHKGNSGANGQPGKDGRPGTDGKGIASTSISYAVSGNGTNAPSGGWQSSIPNVGPGQYLWTRTVINYTAGPSTTAYTVGKIGENGSNGAPGAPGATGQGVQSITELYKILDTKTQQSTPTNDSGWSTTPPSWSPGKYIHTCSKIVYKNPTKTEYTQPVCDSSWEAVNEIEIGGRNILKTSGQFGSSINNWFNNGGGLTVDTDILFNGYNTIRTNVGSGITGNWYKLENDVEYTYSAMVRANKTFSGSISVPLHYWAGKENQNQGKINVISVQEEYSTPNVWKKISITFKLTQDADSFKPFVYGLSNVDMNIAYLKLEKGNKATDWTPTVEDVQAGIDGAQNSADSAQNAASGATSLAQKVGDKINGITTLDVQGNVKIKGELIADGTITGNAIQAGNFTIIDSSTMKPTLSIGAKGNLELDGTLRSSNFDLAKGTGYRITPDGTAILNQAEIKGDIKLPNAGITNFGAQLGNENFIPNSMTFSTPSSENGIGAEVSYDGELKVNANGTANWVTSFIRNYGSIESSFSEGEKFTISFQMKSLDSTNIPTIYLKPGMGYYQMIGDMGTDYSTIYYSGTWKDAGSLAFHLGFSGKKGTYYIRNVKLEKGSTPTPWCPAKKDDLNPVRFWAGNGFANRNEAPFRVRQNGDVYARNVTLEGVLYGSLLNKNLEIKDSALTISTKARMLNSEGAEFQIDSRWGGSTEYVKLSSEQCYLNTDVVFGDNNVKYVKNFETSVSSLELLKTRFSVDGKYIGLNFHPNSDRGINLYTPNGGNFCLTGTYDNSSKGTLVLDSIGSQGDKGDFVLSRKAGRENCRVKIEGDLEINDNFSSSKNQIEMKAQSDGWGFYAY